MKLEQKLVNARPHNIKANHVFTERVMTTIAKKESKRKLGIWGFSRRHPGLAALMAVVSIVLASGGVYAAVQLYLWPHAKVTLTDVTDKDEHTTIAVITDNCGTANKRYNLKPGATVSPEQAPHVVAAECNMNAITEWSAKTFPELRSVNINIGSQLPNKPNNVVKNVQLSGGFPSPGKITAVSSDELVIAHLNGTETTYKTNKDVKVVIDHNYDEYSKLKVGDMVAVIVSDTATMTSRANCTAQKCGYASSEMVRTLRAVVTLDQPLEFYTGSLSSQVYELLPCTGNPADDCTQLGGIVLHELGAGEDPRVPYGEGSSTADKYQSAEVSGRIVSWNASRIVLQTSSGRKVTVVTPDNVIGNYNRTRSSTYGMKVEAGDTLKVTYPQPVGTSNNPTVQAVDGGGLGIVLSTYSLEKGGEQKKL